MCTTGIVYLTMTLEDVPVAANSGESTITGKLAERLVGFAKREAVLEGLIGEGVTVCDTRVTNVWPGHYRVNLYTKDLPEGNFIVPEYKIVASYLLENTSGEVYNRTRRPSSALND